MPTVYIIDHVVYRYGLISILGEHPEFQLVGEGTNTTEALDNIEELKPDIIIMDVFSINGEGPDVIKILKQRCPQSRVLVLTQSQKDEDCLGAIRAGAKGYLLKSLDAEELVECIRLVASGNALVFTSRAARLLDDPALLNNQDKNVINGLSSREKEILELVAQGISTKEIARYCFVSETTIKAHLRRVMEKLEAKNRAQAVAKAIEKGVLTHR